jgi:cysteine-rich repeat protein
VALPAIVALLSAIGASDPPETGGTHTTDLSAVVTPDDAPPSTGITVICDLSSIDDSPTRALFDDGAHQDGAAGDLTFGLTVYIPTGTPFGPLDFACTAADAEGRTFDFTIPFTVISICGDGQVVASEACDDDGTENADGCDAVCEVEAGWLCFGSPSDCHTRCSDGLVVGSEECDDGNHDNGDGCRYCIEMPGWECTGEPSACVEVALCGDGDIEGDEQCDDGNSHGEDGCDSVCTVESAWSCSGTPSCCVPDADPDAPCAAAPDAGVGPDAGEGGGGDGGCCSTGSRPEGSLALAFTLFLVQGLRLSMRWRLRSKRRWLRSMSTAAPACERLPANRRMRTRR